MSSTPSTRRTPVSGSYSSPSSRIAVVILLRQVEQDLHPLDRLVGRSVSERLPGEHGSAMSRSQQMSEQGQREQMGNESLQEVPNSCEGILTYATSAPRGNRDAQEAELLRLRNETREYEVALAESKRESQVLRQDVEDARLEQHRLEDELELRREEIERMNSQIRENQKMKMENQKLAENEVLSVLSAFVNTSQQQRLLEEKEVLVRSNSELSAQLKNTPKYLAVRTVDGIRLRQPETRIPPTLSESSSYATTIREKDRQIDSLQLELADLEVRLAEQANAALSRSRQIEDDLIQVKLENIRLAENVESYQILLQDRTLKGEYSIMSVEGLPERDETEFEPIYFAFLR